MVSLSSGDSSAIIGLVNLLVTGFLAIFVLTESTVIGKLKKKKMDNEIEISEANKITSENNKIVSENCKNASIKELEIKDKGLKFQEIELDFKRQEFNFKEKAIKQIERSSDEISNKIATNLINNPTWLDRFMDEIGATYGGSVYGTRIRHFYYEKKALAKKAIDVLEHELVTDKEMKYCLFIDSGTTTYHLFYELCERARKENNLNGDYGEKVDWANRIFIITNNLPGIQYLMKHCRNGSDEYADLLLKCLLLPGEPLPVYAAVTGKETNNFLDEEHICEIIRDKLDVNDGEYQIISFLSSNYMVRHPSNNNDKGDSYCPVARGGGHYELKTEFSRLSDKIYLISPLTKFSFATCDELNELNGFYIDEQNYPVEAKKFPNKVKYREIKIITDKCRDKCIFIITKREEKDLFGEFADELRDALETSYGEEKVKIATDFKLEQWIPVDINDDFYKDLELRMEVPHSSLRNAYIMKKVNGHFIWSKSWMFQKRSKTNTVVIRNQSTEVSN